MELQPTATYELHVEVLGDESGDWLDALDLLLGHRRREVTSSGPVVSRVWRLPARSDAQHAGELARGVLEHGMFGYRVWLLEPGRPERQLLSSRIG